MATRAVESSEEVAKMYGDFVWVKMQSAAGADFKEVQPKRGSMLIIYAPDLTRLGDYDIMDKEVDGTVDLIKQAFDKAAEKYGPKDTSWKASGDALDGKAKLVVYAFVDDKDASKKTLKNFNDRWVQWKSMDDVTAVQETDLKSELAVKFKVQSAPTVIFVDPAAPEGKQVLERKTGELSARTIKKTLERGRDQAEKNAKK